MHPTSATTTTFAARFVREARSAARLSHPNVVGVYDQGDDIGIVYLAMEYVAGQTLRDVIRERGADAAGEGAGLPRAGARRRSPPPTGRPGPPRRQARERADLAPTTAGAVKVADFGLAKAVSTEQPAHRHRRRADRHRLLPRPRAGDRRPGRRPCRRVRRRRGALRAAHRHQAARGRDPDPGRLQARPRGRPAAVASCPGSRRTSTRWSPAPPPATGSLRPADAAVLLHQVHRVRARARRGRARRRRPDRRPDAAADARRGRRGSGARTTRRPTPFDSRRVRRADDRPDPSRTRASPRPHRAPRRDPDRGAASRRRSGAGPASGRSAAGRSLLLLVGGGGRRLVDLGSVATPRRPASWA